MTATSRYLAGVVALLAACAGCTQATPGHARAAFVLTDKQISDSRRCPIDVVSATRAAGLKTTGRVEHSVNRFRPAALNGRVGGIDVNCSQPLEPTGEINVDIYAEDLGDAVNFTIPQLLVGGMSSSTLRKFRKDSPKAALNTLIDLPGVDGTALARITVAGSKSSILIVRSEDANTGQVRAVAKNILAKI